MDISFNLEISTRKTIAFFIYVFTYKIELSNFNFDNNKFVVNIYSKFLHILNINKPFEKKMFGIDEKCQFYFAILKRIATIKLKKMLLCK